MRARRFLSTVSVVAIAVFAAGISSTVGQPAALPPNATPAVAITSHVLTAADYPAESIRLMEQGTVAVRFQISEAGDVSECTVTTGSGQPRLDDAACAFVRRWKYQPATLDGKAVSIASSVNVVFQLRGAPGPYQDGVAAAERGDFATAFMHWRPLADAGVPQAQASIGLLYLEGRGVERNPAEGRRWFRLAAEQGFAPAQTAMGLIFASGRDVPRDFVELVKWFERAAQGGDARGQRFLAIAYRQGDGVARDPAKAVEWLRKAADQRDAEAQVLLGQAYNLGEGVSQDLAEAFRWFEMAAEQNNGAGQMQLARAYLDGKGIAQNPIRALMWFWVASAAPGIGEAALAARRDAERARNALRDQLTRMENAQAVRMAFNCSVSKFTECEIDAPGVPSASAVPVRYDNMLPGDYPEISLRLQEQGAIGARVIVATDGTIRECIVALSSGKPRLDEAACKLIKARWHYEPVVENGMPVESVHDTTVIFSLPLPR